MRRLKPATFPGLVGRINQPKTFFKCRAEAQHSSAMGETGEQDAGLALKELEEETDPPPSIR